jgi:hypothetical protein
MVEKITGQSGAFAKLMLAKQILIGVAGGKIKRVLVAHFADDAELKDQ